MRLSTKTATDAVTVYSGEAFETSVLSPQLTMSKTMSTKNCTDIQGKKRAVSYGEILKNLPGRSRDLVTSSYRLRGGDLDRVDRGLHSKTRREVGPANPYRTLQYIRNAVESYKAGGEDQSAAAFTIGLIERILNEEAES